MESNDKQCKTAVISGMLTQSKDSLKIFIKIPLSALPVLEGKSSFTWIATNTRTSPTFCSCVLSLFSLLDFFNVSGGTMKHTTPPLATLLLCFIHLFLCSCTTWPLPTELCVTHQCRSAKLRYVLTPAAHTNTSSLQGANHFLFDLPALVLLVMSDTKKLVVSIQCFKIKK